MLYSFFFYIMVFNIISLDSMFFPNKFHRSRNYSIWFAYDLKLLANFKMITFFITVIILFLEFIILKYELTFLNHFYIITKLKRHSLQVISNENYTSFSCSLLWEHVDCKMRYHQVKQPSKAFLIIGTETFLLGVHDCGWVVLARWLLLRRTVPKNGRLSGS